MRIEEKEGIYVFYLEDRYLQDTEPPNLISYLKDHLKQGHKKFIFNFASVHHLITQVMGLLVVCGRRCDDAGAILKLSNLNEFIMKTLETTHLSDQFEIYESVDEALESFRDQQY